ncbi:15324_t:CDS:2, partial [Dentiscutata heterogama]
FLFSLNDLDNPQSAKLGRVTNSDYAVYCHNYCGPTFGGSPALGGGSLFGSGSTPGGGSLFRSSSTLGGGIGNIQTSRDSHDLHVPNNGNIWQCNVYSYPDIGIPNSFTISDYEVFQVIKN